MDHLILTAFVLVTVYVLYVLVRPTVRCPRCKGKRVIEKRRRVKPCPRCHATGRARPRGATLIHGFVHQNLWPWLQERIRPELPDDNDLPQLPRPTNKTEDR